MSDETQSLAQFYFLRPGTEDSLHEVKHIYVLKSQSVNLVLFEMRRRMWVLVVEMGWLFIVPADTNDQRIVAVAVDIPAAVPTHNWAVMERQIVSRRLFAYAVRPDLVADDVVVIREFEPPREVPALRVDQFSSVGSVYRRLTGAVTRNMERGSIRVEGTLIVLVVTHWLCR